MQVRPLAVEIARRPPDVSPDLASAEDFDCDQWSVVIGLTLYFGGE